MGIIASTGNDTIITIPEGVTMGTFRIRHHNVTIRGATTRDACVLKLDDSHASVHSGFVFEFPPLTPDGKPISKITIENLTIDADHPALTSAFGASSSAGPLEIVITNVLFNHISYTAIPLSVSGVTSVLTDVEIRGDGKNLSITAGTTTINGLKMYGCGGIIVTEAGKTAKVTARNVYSEFDYWAGRAGETVVSTAFGTNYVDVESHSNVRTAYDVVRVLTPKGTIAQPTGSVITFEGLERFDRVEDSTGVWAQVESVNGTVGTLGPWHRTNSRCRATGPTGDVTIFRLTLGRMTPAGWTATRLTVKNWHDVFGEFRATPTQGVVGQRVEIRRVATGQSTFRDVDVGGVHFTAPTTFSSVTDSYFRGGFSDQVTLRGRDNTATRVTVEFGQDMGFTLGPGLNIAAIDCVGNYNGICGFTMEAPMAVSVIRCRGDYNGVQREPTIGWAMFINSSVNYYIDSFEGVGNRLALTNLTPTSTLYAACPPLHMVVGRPMERPSPPVFHPSAIFIAAGSSGDLIDITNAAITVAIREVDTQRAVAYKRSTAAGGSGEIEIRPQTTYPGEFFLKLSATDIAKMTGSAYVFDAWIVLSTGTLSNIRFTGGIPPAVLNDLKT